MSVVGKRLRLVGERVGGIVNERSFAVLIAKGLEEGARHVVQLYHRNVLAPCHLTHSVRIVAMCLLYLCVRGIVEESALCRCDKNYVSTLCPHPVDEYLQVVGKVIPSSTSWLAFLLVVVSKLAEHIVALSHCRHHLVEAV